MEGDDHVLSEYKHTTDTLSLSTNNGLGLEGFDFTYELSVPHVGEDLISVKDTYTSLKSEESPDFDSNRPDLNDEGPVPESALIYKKSKLLNIIGSYKVKFSSRMGIIEYLLHTYAILHSPNIRELYNYEVVLENTKPDSEDFWDALRNLTRDNLSADNFPKTSKCITLLSSFSKREGHSKYIKKNFLKKIDSHFTKLCKCHISILEHENPDDSYLRSIRTSTERARFLAKILNEYKTMNKHKNLDHLLDVAMIFDKNYDLSSDVLYEVIKQHGNRFVQRSLYSTVKNAVGTCTRGINPNVTAKLSESNDRIKNFIDIIQQSSIDTNDETDYFYRYNGYFGEERRCSARRIAQLRRQYTP